MKKITTILTAALMLCAVFAFAADKDNVTAKVKASFVKDFSAAADVSWEKQNDFYLAKFTINQLEVNAAYNEAGELVATSRSIETSLLPLNVSMEVAKKYEGYTVSPKSMELNYEGTTRYYLYVENDKQVLKLKCSGSGNIEVERKTKKK
jgi:carbamoylphosphate synthase large subunit